MLELREWVWSALENKGTYTGEVHWKIITYILDDTEYYKIQEVKIMNILRVLFPALMVVGALGSLVVNIVGKGDYPTSLQWVGACLLYTALMLRNRG